jgi:hypothetical protein
MVDLFSKKASVVITNVPGPKEAVVLAGRCVSGTIGWPPESGDIGLGIAFISYAGDLLIGIMADDSVVAQPGQMLADIIDELQELLHGQAVEHNG